MDWFESLVGRSPLLALLAEYTFVAEQFVRHPRNEPREAAAENAQNRRNPLIYKVM